MFRIVPADLDAPDVIAMLDVHVTRARAESGLGSSHALDRSGLKSPAVRVWTLHDAERLAGIGALMRLNAEHGEVKSMYTAESHRRRGVARIMVEHIIAEARAAGFSRLSLDTGSWPYFKPAVALYRSHGFTECQPFGDYVPDPNSVFMTLELKTGSP
ncbi:GNAT family N-acetyltransferase [Pseudorhodoplanes sp.]|uniref:GNAT family N-acetyltransferase n=1 Tax=Pseudorhodoplanes sp. TaxID=1934341 RepID=UPI00391C784A